MTLIHSFIRDNWKTHTPSGTLYVSAKAMEHIRQLPTGESNFTESGIPIVETLMLPVPETAAACDLSTREEIRVVTGEWIHMMLIPPAIYSNTS